MIISPQAENSCDHKFLYLLTVLGHKKKNDMTDWYDNN